MKHLLVLLALLCYLSIDTAQAQTFTAYFLQGNKTIRLVTKGKAKPAKATLRQTLSVDCFISIARKGQLILIDSESQRVYAVPTPVKSRVSDIIMKQEPSLIKKIGDFIAGMWKKNETTSMPKYSTYKTSVGSTNRGSIFDEDTDSLIVE